MFSKDQNYLDLFQTYLVATFGLIKKIHPDHRRLASVIQKFRTIDRDSYVQYTLNNLGPHIGLICSEDLSLFSNDYSSGPLFLIVGLDFKPLWQRQTVDPAITSEIFVHLQLLFIYGSLALKQNKSLVRDMIENLKVYQDIEKEVEEAEAAEAREKESLAGGLEGIFGLDNPILNLVMDVIKDPELQRQFQLPTRSGDAVTENPTELLSRLFTQDNINNMKTLFQKKLSESNLTMEDLERETHKTSEVLMKKMKSNPLLRGLNIDKMMSDFAEKMESDPGCDPDGRAARERRMEQTISQLSQSVAQFDQTNQDDRSGVSIQNLTTAHSQNNPTTLSPEIEAEFSRLKNQ